MTFAEVSAVGAERQDDSPQLLDRLETLREEVLVEGDAMLASWRPMIGRSSFLPSARNLAHYIALRRHELRALQLELMPLGLSSLGRCESRVLENLEAVISALSALTDPGDRPAPAPDPSEFFRGHDLLREHTEAALGPLPGSRDVLIMVTLPTAAADDHRLVSDLVRSGMNVARINCAHDDADVWTAMAEQVRRAASEAGRSCRVCMDICGPRARTRSVVLHDNRRVQVGERLLMQTDAAIPAEGEYAARFELSLSEPVAQVAVGTSVWINEGKLGALVEGHEPGGVILRVTRTGLKGAHLRDDKGVNFPDTELDLVPLTAKDQRDLDTVAETADIIGYSFVQRASDVRLLQDELRRRGKRPEDVPLIAKIETKLAVRNLPELIVQAAGSQPLAVMIARGDLAVELGLRRMAEVQEEILWLCEAAHMPVIWATQVLDNFVHKGVGARAEITDMAMAERAECVMLNKGPFAVEAVELLDDVLGRMESHQFKKASRLRALHSW